MRKIYSTLTALLAMFALNANADRVLYSEYYESGVPSTWTVNGGTASIGGDTEGHFLSFATGSNNGRSAHALWGESIFDEVKDGLTNYQVTFDFQFQAFGNNQYNGEIAVFSGENCAATNGQGNSYAGDNNKAWNAYSNLTPNCLFGIAQNSATSNAAMDTDHTHWFINGDSTNVFTPTAGTWYIVTLDVDIAAREVAYTIEDYDGAVSLKGTKKMAEDANLFASGLYLMNARYQSVTNVDNLKVLLPGVDYANDPVVALTGLNMAERTYTITFLEGETINITGTDGTTIVKDYYDCDPMGTYTYTTTTSGTLSAYTTCGALQSNTVSVEVVCEAIVLPAPSYAIVAAEAGYAKTYQFTLNPKEIELEPSMFMDFKFTPEDGTEGFELRNETSGVKVTVPAKGSLEVTTKAVGYANGTTTIMNDQEYVEKHVVDFQHMDVAKLNELGFSQLEDLNSSNTSGESNWTARQRLYYSIETGEVDEDLNPVLERHVVYGFTQTAEGADTGFESIKRFMLVPSKITEEAAHTMFAPVYTWNTASDGTDIAAIKFNLGIGLINTGVKADGEGGSGITVANASLGVDGLTDEDVIVVTKITDYGSTSVHPVFPVGTKVEDATAAYKAMNLGGASEVYKGTETFSLYRIQDAITRVTVLAPKDGTGIDELNYNKIVSDHNAPIYNMNGVRMNPNSLQKGIYVKQGKKFVVR